MRQIRDQRIEGEHLVLNAGEINYLGPNLELCNCKVEIKVPTKDLVVSQVSMINCEIVFPKKTINYDWYRTKFGDCKFTGWISGHDFGYSPKVRNSIGEVVNCDFTEAILDGCRFYKVEVKDVRLPRWPCFAVLNPFQEITRMRIEGGPVLKAMADTYEYSTATPDFIVEYASTIAERKGFSLESILEEVSGKDWIIVHR